MRLLEPEYRKDGKNCHFFALGPFAQAVTVLPHVRGTLPPAPLRTFSRAALFQTRPGPDGLAANQKRIWQEALL